MPIILAYDAGKLILTFTFSPNSSSTTHKPTTSAYAPRSSTKPSPHTTMYFFKAFLAVTSVVAVGVSAGPIPAPAALAAAGASAQLSEEQFRGFGEERPEAQEVSIRSGYSRVRDAFLILHVISE